jgi:tight adherence protein C
MVRGQTEARLEVFVGPSLGVGQAPKRGPSFLSRTLTPLTPLVAVLAELTSSLLPDRQLERIRANLAMAGMPYSRQAAQFLAVKAGMALGAALLAGLYLLRVGAPLVQMLVTAALAGVLGFYLPGIWLGRRMASRQQQVLKALPDALDLLSISVSAGLGFDGAMLEVVQRWQNPLTEEFAAVLRDLKLGTSRRDALREFARRTGIEDVANFVAAVIQADELGTPMREVLNVQAEQMRMRRRHRAEERARKATIKMLLPMVLFIFPALYVVLLGPAVPSLSVLRGVSQSARR